MCFRRLRNRVLNWMDFSDDVRVWRHFRLSWSGHSGRLLDRSESLVDTAFEVLQLALRDTAFPIVAQRVKDSAHGY